MKYIKEISTTFSGVVMGVVVLAVLLVVIAIASGEGKDIAELLATPALEMTFGHIVALVWFAFILK
jgi:hypothetical protein